MLSLAVAAPSYVMPGRAPVSAPRADAAVMELNPGWFPTKGKGKAIPFLAVPAHLDGTYAGDNVSAACAPGRLRPLRTPADPPHRASTRWSWAARTT